MPHDISLITTIAAALGFGLIFGMLAVRLKLPALVGYLAAGIVIGPATPGFVADVALASQLAEIGVMLLMFGVGLHFSLKDLMEVRRIALPGAILQIAAATGDGRRAGAPVGLEPRRGPGVRAGAVGGQHRGAAAGAGGHAACSTPSTAASRSAGWWSRTWSPCWCWCCCRPLSGSLGGTRRRRRRRILWIALAITLGQVAAFVAFMLLVGRKLFPWFLWRVAKTGSRELFTLA